VFKVLFGLFEQFRYLSIGILGTFGTRGRHGEACRTDSPHQRGSESNAFTKLRLVNLKGAQN
jgi:hypothetical protein